MAEVGATRTWLPGASGARLGPKRYALLSSAYLLVYFATNFVTQSRTLPDSTITLWSPDDGMSLLLLVESTAYTPIVLAAAIFVDLYIAKSSYNLYSVVASELALTSGYFCVSIILRDVFKFEKWETSYKNTIAVLAVVPASAAATGILYCGTLYLTGSLALSQVYMAIRTFWIGDTVGMIVVLPAATAIHDVIMNGAWRKCLDIKNMLIALSIAGCTCLFVYVSASAADDRYLFNMIFLPMIWLGIKYGFAAVAILLLFVQALLIFALSYFKIDNTGFTVFQTLMFIMASTGQLLGAVFTEREHAARALRHQRAELARVSSQATTAAMAVTMAHEISQPLSSLSSYVHSARRMIDGGRPMESIRNALEKAESESRRTRDIIERIRNFVSSGRLAFERTDLDEIARKIVMLNVDEARSRGIELVGDFDEATPDVVADRIAVEQALNNLVTNAIEASAERIDRSGVGPERRSGRVLVRLRRHANRVVLQVDDDGPGVAPDIEEKMFEVFETTKPGGMGLGLPLTLQIARKHSGRLEWRPLKPHGSSFLMELPIDGPQDDAR